MFHIFLYIFNIYVEDVDVKSRISENTLDCDGKERDEIRKFENRL